MSISHQSSQFSPRSRRALTAILVAAVGTIAAAAPAGASEPSTATPVEAVQTTVEKVAAPATAPVDQVVEPVRQSVAERVVEPVRQRVTEPVRTAAEPVAEPIRRVAEPVAAPVREAVAAPVEKVAGSDRRGDERHSSAGSRPAPAKPSSKSLRKVGAAVDAGYRNVRRTATITAAQKQLSPAATQAFQTPAPRPVAHRPDASHAVAATAPDRRRSSTEDAPSIPAPQADAVATGMASAAGASGPAGALTLALLIATAIGLTSLLLTSPPAYQRAFFASPIERPG